MTLQRLSWAIAPLILVSSASAADGILVVGGEGNNCLEDPQCINRIHPDIPMADKKNKPPSWSWSLYRRGSLPIGM